MRLLRLETEPLLDLGTPGNFDNAGMGPSAALFGGAAVVFTTVVTLLAMPEIRESRPQPVLADGM